MSDDDFRRALTDNDRFERTMERLLGGWTDFFWNAFTALQVNGISGDYVEFGSLSGTTLWLAYEQMLEGGVPRHLWTFDSFEGYPDTDDPRDEHPSFKGSGGGGLDAFHAACARNGVPADAYTAVAGYYEDTLPPLGTDAPPDDIALVYLDCNLYSSTVTALEFLAPRLKHGMIIAYDDWFCWSDTQVVGRAPRHRRVPRRSSGVELPSLPRHQLGRARLRSGAGRWAAPTRGGRLTGSTLCVLNAGR